MNRLRIKYFIFRQVLRWIPDAWFVNLIRFINAWRFKKSFYSLSTYSFFGNINRIKGMVPDPDMVLLADKSNMRERLRGLYGLSCFVPLIGVYRDMNDLFCAELKYPCIIKMNRGSGMNVVVHSHDELVSKRVMDTIRFWFTVDPYHYSRELHYSSMSPCLVVEAYLGDNLLDYKVYCFNGVPKFIQVDIDRFSGHRRAFYDLSWNLLDFGMIYPKPNQLVHQPQFLIKMVEIASTISKTFEFVRIDFYLVENKLFLGECTFFPEGGMGLFDNRGQDERVGSMFKDKTRVT